MIEKKINIIDYFKLKNSFGKAYIAIWKLSLTSVFYKNNIILLKR